MPDKKEILLFFTSSFPYGKGEQFIETEILFLARSFKEVHIFPLSREGEARVLPPNVKVIPFDLYLPYNRISLILRHPFFILSAFFSQVRRSSNRKVYLSRPWKQIKYLLHRINDALRLEARLAEYDQREIRLYSYWFNTWVTILALLKRMGKVDLPLLSRAHGGDYDKAQKKTGYFPFRSLELAEVDTLVPVSKYGENYFRTHYPFYSGHLTYMHLGVRDLGDNPLNESGTFHIVTCSFMIPLKRLHLVIEILKEIGLPVKWTHIGDGELMGQIREKAKELPADVQAEFKGHLSNADVIGTYRTQPVDLFMNVSELEGIPVSIMEAISFGIPVTGCRICGVPEIVTERTGFLFEKDIDIREAASRLRTYLLTDRKARVEFRKGVKAFWKEEFDAERNYPGFIQRFLA